MLMNLDETKDIWACSEFFSSPELKAQVSFSDRMLSVACLSFRPSVCFDFFYRWYFRWHGKTLDPVSQQIYT